MFIFGKKQELIFLFASFFGKRIAVAAGDPLLIVSYEISLKGLIYYSYHLTTLKHTEDLNRKVLNYLILLLNMD